MKYETFFEAVEDYIEYRRKLRFDMRSDGNELRYFAQYAYKIGHKGPITNELAVQWAKLSREARPKSWARRLDAIRHFAEYMKLLVPETEVPPKRILRSFRQRPTPHIYSDKEIADLLRAARNLGPVTELRPHTYVTLFGLLACTGMRISEALNLLQEDIDFHYRTAVIRESKFCKSRIILLHPTALEALKSYITIRDKMYPILKTKSLFVTEDGDPLNYCRVSETFQSIGIKLGWRKKTGHGPRIYDLRHTFATRRLLEWYRNGDDVHQKISQLSTYMGHVLVMNTYWYLSAIPELMAVVASRFEKFVNRKEK